MNLEGDLLNPGDRADIGPHDADREPPATELHPPRAVLEPEWSGEHAPAGRDRDHREFSRDPVRDDLVQTLPAEVAHAALEPACAGLAEVGQRRAEPVLRPVGEQAPECHAVTGPSGPNHPRDRVQSGVERPLNARAHGRGDGGRLVLAAAPRSENRRQSERAEPEPHARPALWSWA